MLTKPAMTRVRDARSLIALAVALAGWPAAHAGDLEGINMFRNVAFLQVGDGAALLDNGAFLSTAVTTLGSDSYATARVTFGGASSPLDLTMNSATNYGYQSGTLASKATLDAEFPSGFYRYALSDPGPVQVAQFELGGDHYAQSQPYLAGSSYSVLQSADATAPLNLQFSPFVTQASASYSFIFFTIYDYSAGQFVFHDSFLAPTTPGEALPANLLRPGHSYAYELIYSSRILLASTGTNLADAQVGFELRTVGQFSTAAVPEPASWVLMLAGAAVVAGSLPRRRAGRSGRLAQDVTTGRP